MSKEKLSEMIQNAVGGCAKYWADVIAGKLIAEGVIVPPCKVGDKIYAHWNCGKHGKSVAEFTVEHIDIDYLPEIEIAYRSRTSHSGTYHFAKLKDFGKTVFLTREEAEKALERSENEQKRTRRKPDREL